MQSLTLKIFLFISVLILTGCGEIKTDNAEKCYKKWTGQDIPKEVKIIKGQYWQSGHFTKEYILYMELNSDKKWWTEFVRQNKLIIDTTNWAKPDDSPNWFNPSVNSVKWKMKDDLQGSRYFYDTKIDKYFIYEIQL